MDREEINAKAAYEYGQIAERNMAPAVAARETLSGSVMAELDDLANALDYTCELTVQLGAMLTPVLFDGDTAGDPVGPEETPRCELALRVRARTHQAVSANTALRDLIERLRLS